MTIGLCTNPLVCVVLLPLCLSAAVLEAGNRLHPTLPFHPLDAPPFILVGDAVLEAVACHAVRETHRSSELPPRPGELVSKLRGGSSDIMLLYI